MSNINTKISNEVKAKRRALGLSQEKLADMIEKSPGFVGQLERGESSLKVETLQKIVHCLGMDANALLANDNVPPHEICELCNLAEQMDKKKLGLLVAIAHLLQQTQL